MNHAAKTKQKKQTQIYTQNPETKERIPRINKPNAKPNWGCMYPFWCQW